MFFVNLQDVQNIAGDFGIAQRVLSVEELQRYHYERDDPASRQVRLIVKANLADGSAFVLRFKNEEGVTRDSMERQCAFADLLRRNGIRTPRQLQAAGRFVAPYVLGGYEVLAAAEEFAGGQLRLVDAPAAQEIGGLLARMHNLSEAHACRAEHDVLFDPFAENDLFTAVEFRDLADSLQGEESVLHERILSYYEEYMQRLAPLRGDPRYAVQGDLSDCNLYRASDGELGVFDFNWCGDNSLYCDAVMQALFVSRLMDYPEELAGDSERALLPAFLAGYRAERPFTAQQKELFPYLYAIIDAFWCMDILWSEHALVKTCQAQNRAAVHAQLTDILRRMERPPYALARECL